MLSTTIPQTGSLTFIGPTTTGRDIGPPPRKALNPSSARRPAMVSELTAAEVAARIRAAPKEVVLLDVREPYERDLAHIEPSIHIPMRSVPDRLAEIPKDREVIVYCHGGARSAMVAGFLETRGYARVVNLAGGIDAWSRTVDPTVPRYD